MSEGAPGVDAKGELLLYIGLGQSLLALTPRMRPLGEKPGSLDPDRAWVFSETGDPRIAANPFLDLPEAAFAKIHPHLRTGRSGPLTAASSEILAALRTCDRLLTVNFARRGAHLSHFGRETPTASFRNLERCLARAAAIAAENDLRLERLVLSWVHGQADDRSLRYRYIRRLAILADDIETAFRAVTAGKGRLHVCISQATATRAPGERGVPLAQIDLARINAARADRAFVAGPEYMLERSDGVHLKPRSAVYLGAMHGRAIACVLGGQTWLPLQIASATVSGDLVTVDFHGGLGPLVAHEDDPGPPGQVRIGARPLPHFGFRWHDEADPDMEIVAARITGPRQVTLQLCRHVVPGKVYALSLGFPADIGHPEGFVSGDPATAKGGCTNLRTIGSGIARLGLAPDAWALQQVVSVPSLAPR